MEDDSVYQIILPENEQIKVLQKQMEEVLRFLKAPRKLVRDENGRITGSVIE